MAMPIGLRRLSELHPAGVAWAWGINGITSVLGSAVGVFVAINWGYAVTTLVALACYLVALAHAFLGRWPQPDRAPIDGPGDGRRRSRLRSRVPVTSGSAASTT